MTPEELHNLPYTNLQAYEREELQNEKEIYYYGQNCRKKKRFLKELNNPDGTYNWTRGDHLNYRYELM